MHDQRKADRIGVESIVDQTFRDVTRPNAAFGLALVAEHALVHAACVERKIVVRLEQRPDVVRVQHRIHRHVTKSLAAVRHDVGERANVHADVSIERSHPANGLRQIVLPRPAVLGALQSRLR